MKKRYDPTMTREKIFTLKADSDYGICYTQTCPLREHCLRCILRDYLPNERRFTSSVNLDHQKAQTESCPLYRNDQPIRMPLGLSNMYYNMPARIERALKHHLIAHFNRKRYYEYHSGYRPTLPDHEQYIRRAARNFGWNEPLEFNAYVEDYLW